MRAEQRAFCTAADQTILRGSDTLVQEPYNVGEQVMTLHIYLLAHAIVYSTTAVL